MQTGVMRLRRWFLGAAAVAVLGACSSRGPLLHELGADALYERGMASLEKEDWSDALRALEQMASRFPNDPRIEKVRFEIGNAYFGKKEYVTAAAEYVRLATDYPTSEYVDDARFKACESYYRLSPPPQRDQEYTHAAINHCQALATYYPESEYTPKALALIDELNAKLAQKVFLNGEHYFKRQALDSSIIYYEDLLSRYPNSEYAPRALLRLVQVYQRLGYKEEMEEAKQRLMRAFPETSEAETAREITLADGR